MRKNLKIKVYMGIAILMSVITIMAVIVINKGKDKELPISRGQVEYIVDVNNPQEMVGLVDYVFVGYVKEKVNTTYVNPELEDGNPVTMYNVTVLSNIKGELVQNEDIQLGKYGGVSQNGEYIYLDEGDALLQENQVYLFWASGNSKGELRCSSPTSSMLIDTDEDIDSIRKNVESFSIVKTYKEVLKNEIKFNRDRYWSKYNTNAENVNIGVPYETRESIS